MNKRSQAWVAYPFCLVAAALTAVVAAFGNAWLLLVVVIGGMVMAVVPVLMATHNRFMPVVSSALSVGLFTVTGAALVWNNGLVEAAVALGLFALLPLALAAHLLTEVLVQARIQAGLFSLDPEVRKFAETALHSYTADMACGRTPAARLWRYFARKDTKKAEAKS